MVALRTAIKPSLSLGSARGGCGDHGACPHARLSSSPPLFPGQILAPRPSFCLVRSYAPPLPDSPTWSVHEAEGLGMAPGPGGPHCLLHPGGRLAPAAGCRAHLPFPLCPPPSRRQGMCGFGPAPGFYPQASEQALWGPGASSLGN